MLLNAFWRRERRCHSAARLPMWQRPHLAPHLIPQAAATARELWRGMAADGVQPNGMAVAAFLEILLLEGEIDEALEVRSCFSRWVPLWLVQQNAVSAKQVPEGGPTPHLLIE